MVGLEIHIYFDLESQWLNCVVCLENHMVFKVKPYMVQPYG